jgi:hypothetical protein
MIEVYAKAGDHEAAGQYAEKLLNIIRPEEARKFMNPVSYLNLLIPSSTEVIHPVLSRELKERSQSLIEISEKLVKN